jgi:hypothetical protein
MLFDEESESSNHFFDWKTLLLELFDFCVQSGLQLLCGQCGDAPVVREREYRTEVVRAGGISWISLSSSFIIHFQLL